MILIYYIETGTKNMLLSEVIKTRHVYLSRKQFFLTYRKLIKYCKWNKDSFDKYYVPKFLQQMQGREEKDALNQLYVMSKTQNILLVCFCENEDLCHRSIIAGLLSGAGAEVQTSSGHNYDKYWDMYHNLCN